MPLASSLYPSGHNQEDRMIRPNFGRHSELVFQNVCLRLKSLPMLDVVSLLENNLAEIRWKHWMKSLSSDCTRQWGAYIFQERSPPLPPWLAKKLRRQKREQWVSQRGQVHKMMQYSTVRMRDIEILDWLVGYWNFSDALLFCVSIPLFSCY